MKKFLTLLFTVAAIAVMNVPVPAKAADGDLLVLQISGTSGAVVQDVVPASTKALLMTGTGHAPQAVPGVTILTGTASPIGSVAASPMTLFFLNSGTTGTIFIKASGTTSSGWLTLSGT